MVKRRKRAKKLTRKLIQSAEPAKAIANQRAENTEKQLEKQPREKRANHDVAASLQLLLLSWQLSSFKLLIFMVLDRARPKGRLDFLFSLPRRLPILVDDQRNDRHEEDSDHQKSLIEEKVAHL